MQEDAKLGTVWSHTDRFAFLRRQHLGKVTPIRVRVIADFELISHQNSHQAGGRVEATGVDLSAAKDCQHCGTKFGFFEKKHACGICKRVVCVNDSRLQQLIPPASASMTVCRKCYTFIKFHFHQAELKRRIVEAQSNIAVVLYGTLMAIKDEIVHELPKFRGIVFSLSAIFGDTPEQQDKIREGRDDGGPLPFSGRTLEELFTQGMSSQKRLKSVFAALEERLSGIQAASSDTKTQQRMIALLKQAMADFLTSSLPLFRFSSQRLAEIKDHPKTRRLLVEAKEDIRQEELNAARKEQEEADRKRYQALVGNAPTPVFGSASTLGEISGSPSSHPSFTDKLVAKVQKAGQSAYHSISKQIENLNESHLIPEISGVIPAICPSMGGVPLALRGFNFHQNLRVYVNGKKLDEWQVLWKSPQEIMIISPPLEIEGPVDLEVENPNQASRGILEGVLFCTNDPAIIETFFGVSAIAPNPPTSSSSSSRNASDRTATTDSNTNWSSSSPPSGTSPTSSLSTLSLTASPTKSSDRSVYGDSGKRSTLVEPQQLPPGYAAAIAPSPFHLAPAHSEPVVGSPPSYATLATAPKYTSQTNPPTSEPASAMKVSRTFGARH
jgi:hypothetical protein